MNTHTQKDNIQKQKNKKKNQYEQEQHWQMQFLGIVYLRPKTDSPLSFQPRRSYQGQTTQQIASQNLIHCSWYKHIIFEED